MPSDLGELIRGLSPGALEIFKRQLAALPDSRKQIAYQRLSNIPELSDILGEPPTTRRPIEAKQDVPLWQRGLQAFGAPFKFVQEKAIEPIASVATAPFSPTTPETQGLPFFQRELAEYKGWKAPRGVKGAVEMLPWLALPGIGAVGKVGFTAGRFAPKGIAGMLAKQGTAGRVAGQALELSPWGLAEKGTGAALRAIGKGAKKLLAGEGGAVSWGGHRFSADRIAAWRKRGFGQGDIENFATMPDEIIALHTDPVRIKGFWNAEPVKVLDYLNKLQEKLGKVDPDKKGVADIALEYYNKGEIQNAVTAAEDALSYIHSATKIVPTVISRMTKVRAGRTTKQQDIQETAKILSGKLKEAGIPEKDISNLLDVYNINVKVAEPRASLTFEQLRNLEDKGITEDNVRKLTREILAKKFGVPSNEVDLVLGGGSRTNPILDIQQAEIGARKIDNIIKSNLPTHSEILTSLNKLTSVGKKSEAGFIKLGMFFPELKPKKLLVPTEAHPEGIVPKAQTIIQDVTDLINMAKPARMKTERLYTKERGVRARKAAEVLEKGTGEEAFVEARAKLAGKYPTAKVPAQFEEIRTKITPEVRDELFNVIKDTHYNKSPELNYFARQNTAKAFQKLLLGQIPQENELRLFEKTFGPEFVKAVMNKASGGAKFFREAMDVLNAPRALLSAVDISGLLRQGGVLTARHPIEAFKSIKPMLKAMFSDENERLMDDIIRASPNFQSAVDHNLYIAPRAGEIAISLAQHEEAFMSNLTNKIGFVKASNRAYITGLNSLRINVWEKTLQQWKNIGAKTTDQDLFELAQLINWSTGRGTLPPFIARAGSVANAILFSPKLIASRIELVGLGGQSLVSLFTNNKYGTMSKLVRTEIWKTIGAFLGVGTSIITAASMAGVAKIELDPRSADFGKMKVGNTRLDIWTGYAQYMRLLAQLATTQRKSEGGRIQALNRMEVISRFAQTKLSPAAGLFVDLLRGETFMGEEFLPTEGRDIAREVKERIMPLAVQDMIDAFSQGGVAEAVPALTGFLGVGITTYTDEIKKEHDKAAKEKYGMNWEEVGTKYGRLAQMELTNQTPAIMAAQKSADEKFAAGSPTVMKNWTREGESIEETYRNEITLSAKEFEQTGDGTMFRDRADIAAAYRRMAYGARAARKEYQDITAYYSQPLSPDKIAQMNPNDVLRREYYQKLFAPDMYDQFGRYDFREAEKREAEFTMQHGKQVMDYIDAYSDARWSEKPESLVLLEQAREMLKPYWQITEQVWSMYPNGTKELSDQIQDIAKLNPEKGRQLLRRYPQIVRARELIALQKKAMRQQNPMIDQLLRRFYG